MLPNSEWIVLAVLALVLLKPEDIPKAAKILAKFMRQAQDLWTSLSNLDGFANLDNGARNAPEKNTHVNRKKNPFHLAPDQAKSQPVKD